MPREIPKVKWDGCSPWGNIEEIMIAYGAKESHSNKGGRNYVMDCPECGKPQGLWVMVELGGNEQPWVQIGDWLCYHCAEKNSEDGSQGFGRGGGALGFIRLMSVIEGHDYEDMKAEYFQWRQSHIVQNVNWSDLYSRKKSRTKIDSKHRLEGFIACYNRKTKKVSLPEYFRRRGVTAEQAKRYGLGYVKDGKYRGRVVFPLVDPLDPSRIGYCCRSIDEQKYRPRYLNTDDSAGMVFGFQQIFESDTIVVVEGAFDALSVDRAGYPAVGVLGKSVRKVEESDDLRVSWLATGLSQTQVRRVVFMLDPSAIGAAITQLLQMRRLEWYVSGPLDAKDPGEATPKQIHRAIQLAVPADVACQRYMLDAIDKILGGE